MTMRTSRFTALALPWAVWAQVSTGGTYTVTGRERTRLASPASPASPPARPMQRQRRAPRRTVQSPSYLSEESGSPDWSSGGDSPTTLRMREQASGSEGCKCGIRGGKAFRHSECGHQLACSGCIDDATITFNNFTKNFICDGCTQPINANIDTWLEQLYG